MNVPSWVGLNCAALYQFILVLKAGLSWLYFCQHQEDESIEAAVTILQPILGGDPYLPTALQSNLEQSHAAAVFWWLVDENDAVGNEVVGQLQSQYPRRVRIITCPPCPEGINPKVFKLNLVSNEIETPFVAVLDDDTTLGEGQLGKAIAMLNHCDLYTGLPCYDAEGNFWTSLLAHFVNNNSILTYLSLLNWMEPLTINGMFYVLKRETLLQWNGWNSISEELCDDYAFAKLAKKHNARIYQGITVQTVHTTVTEPGQYLRQMHRWFVFANVLVRDQSWSRRGLLLVLLGLPPLLLVGTFFSLSAGWIGVAIPVLVLIVRHTAIQALHEAIFPTPPKFLPWMSVLSEFCQIGHYFHALISRVVVWRSRRIRVLPNGKFESMADSTR